MPSYRIEAEHLPNGKERFTCVDLPGFRVLVRPGIDASKAILEAFRAFNPLFLAAKARKEAEQLHPTIRRDTDQDLILELEDA